MGLIYARGGFLYQHKPDIIPQGFLTDEELSLWAAFLEMKAEEHRRGG